MKPKKQIDFLVEDFFNTGKFNLNKDEEGITFDQLPHVFTKELITEEKLPILSIDSEIDEENKKWIDILQNVLGVEVYFEENGEIFDEQGEFGEFTKQFVKDFQKDNQLEPTGVVNHNTWDALFSTEKIGERYKNKIDKSPGLVNIFHKTPDENDLRIGDEVTIKSTKKYGANTLDLLIDYITNNLTEIPASEGINIEEVKGRLINHSEDFQTGLKGDITRLYACMKYKYDLDILTVFGTQKAFQDKLGISPERWKDIKRGIDRFNEGIYPEIRGCNNLPTPFIYQDLVDIGTQTLQYTLSTQQKNALTERIKYYLWVEGPIFEVIDMDAGKDKITVKLLPTQSQKIKDRLDSDLTDIYDELVNKGITYRFDKNLLTQENPQFPIGRLQKIFGPEGKEPQYGPSKIDGVIKRLSLDPGYDLTTQTKTKALFADPTKYKMLWDLLYEFLYLIQERELYVKRGKYSNKISTLGNINYQQEWENHKDDFNKEWKADKDDFQEKYSRGVEEIITTVDGEEIITYGNADARGFQQWRADVNKKEEEQYNTQVKKTITGRFEKLIDTIFKFKRDKSADELIEALKEINGALKKGLHNNKKIKDFLDELEKAVEKNNMKEVLTKFINFKRAGWKDYEDSFDRGGITTARDPNDPESRIHGLTAGWLGNQVGEENTNWNGASTLKHVKDSITGYTQNNEIHKYDKKISQEISDPTGNILLSVDDKIEIKNNPISLRNPYTHDNYYSEPLASLVKNEGKIITSDEEGNTVYRAEPLGRYNEITHGLYHWINNPENPLGEKILKKMIEGNKGIILKGGIFVPIEGIQFYFSNKGHNTCSHHWRLTIRYRIRNGAAIYKIIKRDNGEIILDPQTTEALAEENRRDFIYCPGDNAEANRPRITYIYTPPTPIDDTHIDESIDRYISQALGF